MTEYWKSQEKTFCDICKCWLTDNKSSVDFHKNGKRHKENVEKRLKEIQRKNKADEKRDKRFDLDMQRIEKAALAACQKEADVCPDISTQERLSNPSGSSTKESEKDVQGLGEPKIIHRKEKLKPVGAVVPSVLPAPSTSSGAIGAWKTVTTPAFEDLELPQTNRIVYEPKKPEKRKIEFSEKTITALDTNPSSSITNSWIKVEPTAVAFKKRKSSKPNMRQRTEED